MIKVSAAEFHRNIGRNQDLALTQPIAVTRNARERTVMISMAEYHRLKRRDRQVLGLDDLTDADLAGLEATCAPESSKAFDHELGCGCVAFPVPVPGLVIRYSYLWASEYARGQEEGGQGPPMGGDSGHRR